MLTCTLYTSQRSNETSTCKYYLPTYRINKLALRKIETPITN